MNQCFNRECEHNNKSISGCSEHGATGREVCLGFVSRETSELVAAKQEIRQLKATNARLERLLEQSERVNKTWARNFLSK